MSCSEGRTAWHNNSVYVAEYSAMSLFIPDLWYWPADTDSQMFHSIK